MEIIEVKQKRPKDYLRIDYSLGDICNFQCWYCWPEAHAAVQKWPDLELVKKNLSYLLDYYIAHTEKRRFEISVLGGEVTHWKYFIEFMKYFKERYDIRFTIITNGSKSLEWWKEAKKYLDYVYVSHHQRFSKKEHNRDLLDYLYNQNIIAVSGVLMDPNCWEDCMETIEYFKKSKYSWSIRYVQLIHEKVSYTEEQNTIIAKLRARNANIFYFLKNNPSPRTNTKIVYENGKTQSVKDNHIILQRINNFKNWECSLGVDWLAIKINGDISGTCGNLLYKKENTYNLYDVDFSKKFKPEITKTICTQTGCWCGFEANMAKRKIKNNDNKKVIPIYAN